MQHRGQAQGWNPQTVGIALAAYRPNPRWFSEQLASIATQSHQAWFCVITLDSPMSDFSDDPLVSPYMSDPRFIWVQNESQLGIRRNFETAIQIALKRSPDLIALSDQDDIWLPEKLTRSVDAAAESGPLTMVYCDAYLLVNEERRNETLHQYTLKTPGVMTVAERIIQPQVSGFCAVFDASLARLHPTIPPEFHDHDHWYSLVAAAYGGVIRISEPLALYRQHAGNTIGISAIRHAEGWETTTTLQRLSGLRDNAVFRLRLAQRVALELPVGAVHRWLFQNSVGWFCMLMMIIARRLFTDRQLSANAYRKSWGLLLVAPSLRERFQRARSRLPRRLKVTTLAFGSFVAAAIGIAVSYRSNQSVTMLATGLLLLWAAFILSTGIVLIRWLQHQLPHTGALVLGSGSLLGLMLLDLHGSFAVAFIAASLPLVAYVAYRLRWRSDTGA